MHEIFNECTLVVKLVEIKFMLLVNIFHCASAVQPDQ